jgi:D-tyrosyl-tRNA(Tyr) deacylase
MRAVIQRVSEASVEVRGEVISRIREGLLILVAAGKDDEEETARTLAAKATRLRIFPDDEGKMNQSLSDFGGAALVVSQFTLYGDTRKGNRPSFISAAHPDLAEPLVEAFADEMKSMGVEVSKGIFGAQMRVSLVNEGPVTIILDSETAR